MAFALLVVVGILYLKMGLALCMHHLHQKTDPGYGRNKFHVKWIWLIAISLLPKSCIPDKWSLQSTYYLK
jgi:hypothetical protein